MITLHRLGHAVEPFQLNPDLIVTVEATPDTILALTTGTKIVVAESPDDVAGAMFQYRIDVLAGAMQRRHELHAQPHRPRREGRLTPALTSVPAQASAANLHIASVASEGA